MLQLKTPGVYRQDIFPTPALQLLTGVPVFLGLAEKGVINQPKLLTLWPQFVEEFGNAQNDSFLYYAVQGFFNNGGTRCYIIRLDKKAAPKDAIEQGLQALSFLDGFDLVCAPDIMQLTEGAQLRIEIQQAILAHCDRMGDCFAILDAIPTINEQQLQGNNGALYAPWLQVENTSEPISIPPCGHIAGIYARCDREVGVHRAPANYPLQGVENLSLEKKLDPKNLGSRVNYLQPFKGRGIRIWGANTLSQDSNWHYINVRRLFITVRRWVEMSLADVAFEPNNLQLWLRIERELTTYCESLWQEGALKGNTPQEAFYVKCDAETNPPDVQEAGQVITELGLAPTTPNEFIVVSLIHGDSGVSLATANAT